MVSHVNTLCFVGIEPVEIDVQVQICSGIAAFNIVGMANKSVSESKERIRAAFASIGLSLPMKRITINLSPADLLKEGSHFDIAIAIGLLVEMGNVRQEEIENFIIMGELSLDGRISRINGVLPSAIRANAIGFGLICPFANAKEATWSGNKAILACSNLIELINHFNGKHPIPYVVNTEKITESTASVKNMRDVKGQTFAKRALEIAAAGKHHMLMIGPPGAGKSMLAKRLIGIMPKLTTKERLEISVITSIAGELADIGLVEQRPFREPHSSASMAAMIGGGRNAKPGEITLAHCGVLFMDELPEFSRSVLESLRQPIESKKVTISRVSNHVTYPANFQLIAAMNPCKCGYFGSLTSCSKIPKCAEDYQNKISGPLFDRFDLQVEVQEMNVNDIQNLPESEDTETINKRVVQAMTRQIERYHHLSITSNSELDGELLDQYIPLSLECKKMMTQATDKLSLSMRAFNRILKVARTVADLAQSEEVNKYHLSEALTYRIARIRV